jgi:hypothetical protein
MFFLYVYVQLQTGMPSTIDISIFWNSIDVSGGKVIIVPWTEQWEKEFISEKSREDGL